MRKFLSLLAMVLCSASLAQGTQRSDDLANLTVITDPSLLLPMQQLVRRYSTQHHISITLVSSEEKDPETLIGEGMEAHVLISADPELRETLELRGLIDVFAQNPLVRTELVLVRRKGDGNSLSGQWTLANLFLNEGNRLPVFLLDPAYYTEGSRSIAAMNANGVPVDSRIVIRRKRDLLQRVKDEDSAAVLLAPDALLDTSLTVVSVLPESQYDPVVFNAMVLASESMPEARTLVNYLGSEEALAIYRRYGFKPIEK